MSNVEITIYNNICKMFDYRGGTISSRVNDDQVSNRLKATGVIDAQGSARGAPLSVLWFSGGRLINKEIVSKALGQTIKAQKDGECLIVLPEQPSSYVRKYLDDGVKHDFPGIRFVDCRQEIFSLEVPQHVLVPQHRIATAEEIAEFEKAYVTPASQPTILATDPMAIWIGARPGDLVFITAASETAGESIRLRYCK
jgi:DNA-directed RNA polymerase subunit H (RpoH/RPB5)